MKAKTFDQWLRGITKQIRKEKDIKKKDRLKIIKEEFESIKDML